MLTLSAWGGDPEVRSQSSDRKDLLHTLESFGMYPKVFSQKMILE